MAMSISTVGKPKYTVRKPKPVASINPPRAGRTPGIAIPQGAPAAPSAPSYTAMGPGGAVTTPGFGGDSTYFAQLAQLTASRNTAIAGLDEEDKTDTINTENYRGQLAKQSLDSQSSATASAAKMGLINGGFAVKKVGDISSEFERQRSDSALQLAQRISAREIQRQGLGNQYTADAGAALAESEQRWRDSQAPTGASAAKPNTASGNPAFPLRNTQTGQAYKIVNEGGKTIHVYSNGKRVVVR